MLRKETVNSSTLELLNILMQDKKLKDFVLVGVTALSLQIGHRHSIDLDLFTQNNFNSMELLTHLTDQYQIQSPSISNATVLGKMNNIKTDFIHHPYESVEPVLNEENIRLASLADISAMKLSVIVQNGTRLKYFIDIAFLSSYVSFKNMGNFYVTKYKIVNSIMAIKGIAFHEDINFNEPIYLMKDELNWENVRKRLSLMHKNQIQYLNN